VTCGIVLAAGNGRRIGMPKALLSLDGRTFVERTVHALSGLGLDIVVVVNSTVSAALPVGLAGRRLVNPDPDGENGMFGSVRLGISEALLRGAPGVLLVPVDLPLIARTDVQAVLARLTAGAAVAVATHDGRWGHPVGMNRAVMAEVMAAPPGTTLRDVVRRDRARVIEVAASSGAVLGVNTAEDLDRVSNRTFR